MKTPLLPWRKSGRINVVLVGFGEPTGSDEEASDQDSSAQAHSSILSLIRNRHSRQVSPPRCESVRLYGRPGRKHKFARFLEIACSPGMDQAPVTAERLTDTGE
jgi:hypothetical protein